MKTDTNKVSTPAHLLRHGYRYIKLIGEGSNGKTYLSKSLKTGETVAIKALKFSDNLKNYELFKREAETLKSIQTSGTPRFYDYITGEGEFTECWLVQEYIEGESLLDKLNKGKKFDEIQSLELIFDAAKIIHSLQTSYAPPIIHRDIKPSNILVRETPENDTNLFLIDFGAVANPQKRGLNSTVAGTVGYMAPEQLIGDCTIQSDYYALGATALHLMTGINPSEFPTDGFTILFEEKLKQWIPNVHKETIDLLHTLLAPDANDRPKDSKELLKSISQVLVLIKSKIIQKQKKSNKIDHFYESYPFHIFCIFMVVISYFVQIFGTIYLIILDSWLILLSLFIPPLFIAYFSNGMDFYKKDNSKSHNNPALPDYRVQETDIQKYYIAEEKIDLSDNKETAGEIVRIIDNIIEYVVNIEHKYYTVFYQNDERHSYKIGDKVRVKYVKKLGTYRFYDIKPE